MKVILKIASISLFFFIIGYILTYPYELLYGGDDNIKLIEESYECKSLEELLDRKEFRGKVLYVKIWEPFEHEVKSYTEEEFVQYRKKLDSLKSDPDSPEYKKTSLILNGRIVKSYKIENQVDNLLKVSSRYIGKDVEFIYVTYPDSDTKKKRDDMRKWKTAMKKFKIKGYHLIMNHKLFTQIRDQYRERNEHRYLPYQILCNKRGEIVNLEAAWPQNQKLLISQIDKLLKD